MSSNLLVRENTAPPLTNSLRDKTRIQDAGKCVQRVFVLQSGWNPKKPILFLSKLTNGLLQTEQLCFVRDFLLLEYKEDIPCCFPGRSEKGRISSEGKIPFHPEPRGDDLQAGSSMKEWCKLGRVSALDLSKLALFHIWESQGAQAAAAAAKQSLSPRRPEIQLISPRFQPANGALQAESRGGFPSNQAFRGDCSLLSLSLAGRNSGQPT